MKLKDYLSGIDYISCNADLSKEVSDVTSDTRLIKEKGLFVCLKGERFDGHTAAGDMLEKGAAAVITERDLGLPNQIVVKDTRNAYALACHNHFGNPQKKLKLIGVTGTNGKTTITYLLKGILTCAGKKAGLIGTIRNEIMDLSIPSKFTTPEPYQLSAMFRRMLDAGCEYVVMETSSHALHQQRLDGCEFEIGIFTNLTEDHLDYHKTIEEYFKAKKILFTKSKKCIINVDDPYGKVLAEELGDRAITCSASLDSADYTAREIKYTAGDSRFILVAENLIERMVVPMPGKFNVLNAMEAAVAAITLGVDSKDAAHGLETSRGVTGRAEVIPTGKDFTVIRDYAHTPDGLEKILAALKGFVDGRLITLFGCAGKRDRAKRPHMSACVAKDSDLVILTSDNPRDEDPMQIINDALPGFEGFNTPYKVIPDRYTAIVWALSQMQTGDLLLLAGKGHEDYQVLNEETVCFDEREIVMDILKVKEKN